MNIWDKDHECMSRDELEQLQLERLQAVVCPTMACPQWMSELP